MMSSRFLTNLSKLQEKHPQEAFYLEQMTLQPWKDAKELPSCDVDADVLIMYGVGKGEVYNTLLPWLNAKRKREIYFFEDQEIPLRQLLETEVATKLLNHKRVQLHLFHQIEETLHPFNALMWKLYGKKLVFLAHPNYSKKTFKELQERIIFDQERLTLFLDDYLTYGARYYQNFYQNLPALVDSFHGEALFKKYKNVPAIIVGAGPSLDKNGELLKTIGDKGLVLTGGSGLPALLEKGVEPHFGAAIDPNPLQGERMKRARKFKGPLFYRLRLFPEALKALKGIKLYMPGSGGFDTAEWLEKELKIEGQNIEEGHNVVAFLVAIAEKMGCNPIVTVGLDLGYPEGKIYAKGVEEGKLPDDTVIRQDIFGKPIHTKYMWLQESQWLSTFQKEHPDVQLINATEGGLGFEGVENVPLKTVVKKYFTKERKLKPVLKPLGVTPAALKKALKKLKASLENCQVLLEKIEETPAGALYDHALREEVAYGAVLAIFDQILTFLERKDRIPFLKMVVEAQLYLLS